MAAAVYTTDLTTYNDCTSATGWLELIGMALSAPPDIDTDLAIHGSICITSDRAKTGLSSNAFVGAGFTLASGECIFVWHKFFAPNSLATLANGGVRVMVGDSSSVYDGWYVDGSDTYQYGGWVNHVVDPTTTPDQTAGTTTGTYAMVGNGWNLPTQAPSKGNPFGTDIIRYGRGESVFTDGDIANGYATFLGYSLVNDNPTTGRFGLVQAIAGGYLYKGLMSLGTVSLPVDMRDSNLNITIDNTTKVLSTFNAIEVNHISSNIEWTAVNITALGTVSKGTFNAIADATISKTNCVFTDMSTFVYQSNSSLSGCTYRRCDTLTSGGGSLTNCILEDSISTSSVISADLAETVNCSFSSDGTNHAVELSTIGSGSMSWSGITTGYDTGTAASPVTPTSTGNEDIYVNVATASDLTINVVDGATIPSIRIGASFTGSVNVVAGQYDFTISGLAINTEVTILTTGTQTVLYHVEDTSISDGDGLYKIVYTHGGGESIDVLIHHINYIPDISNIYNLTLASAAGSAKVQMFDDPYYNGSL